MPYLPLKKLLSEYFQKLELQRACYDIDEPTSYTNDELISIILQEWENKGRNKYELFGYLNRTTLSRICKAYKLDHKGSKEVLLKRIKKKKLLEQTYSKRNISIVSIIFVLGALASIYGAGLATLDIFDNDGIIVENSGDESIIIIGDGNTVNSNTSQEQQEFAKINSTEMMGVLQELLNEQILEDKQKIKELEMKLSQTTDENERMRLEIIIDKFQLATNSMEVEDFVGAENYYRLILKTDENNIDALEGLGLSLGRQDKFEDSIFYYDQVLKIEEDNYEALINNAWSYAMLEEYEESLTKLNDLEDDNPNDLLVLSHKCWVLHKLDFFESAVEYCEKVLSEGTQDERIPRAYSLSLTLLDRAEEALPFHEKLYELHPDELPIVINYGNTLSDVGQNQEALNIYNKGLEKFENNTVLLHNKKALCINNPQLDC